MITGYGKERANALIQYLNTGGTALLHKYHNQTEEIAAELQQINSSIKKEHQALLQAQKKFDEKVQSFETPRKLRSKLL